MSSQNRFLLPHTSASASGLSSGTSVVACTTSAVSATTTTTTTTTSNSVDEQENLLSVDTDFDSYWEEEARNPHRNRIRIGRQYQATVPPLLKPGESDQRKSADLETLTFCPTRSAKVSNAELDHYFTVAKSLNLFASLVETRSLLGRDVTIADLNHIRKVEGLSLASVIQPTRQSNNYGTSPQSSHQQNPTSASKSSPVKSPPSSNSQTQESKPSPSTSVLSPNGNAIMHPTNTEVCTLNQPLMKALSHFISLHHPCHHDQDCKKLHKDTSLEEDATMEVSITAGNLRQVSSASGSPAKSRSRSSLKHQAAAAAAAKQSDEKSATLTDTVSNLNDQDQQAGSDKVATQTNSFVDWTQEEIELFSKAIEVCGKNFGSIKKEFLPTKSVRSIVEYYYIGSRDVSDCRKKSSQNTESGGSCTSPEKLQTNTYGGGSGGDGAGAGDTSGPSSSSVGGNNNNCTSSNRQVNNTSEIESRTTSMGLTDSDNNSVAIADGKTNLITDLDSERDDSGMSYSKSRSTTKNLDARMSIYNFDDEFKDESPVKLECLTRPGAEVKPLKAKPIIPNVSLGGEAGNSNVGSLKFFMDGQLVLKLNACQDQQEGAAEKCHWVQSGEKILSNNRQKRYSKRANSDNRAPSEPSLNGSYSNSSVLSPNNDDDSKNDDLTLDEDSKESANSLSNTTTPPRPKKQPTPKRAKTSKTNNSSPGATQHNQAPSPVDYNRMAINNRIKELSDGLNGQLPVANMPLMNHAATAAAAASSMPNWLQANQFAMAAAILGGLPFPAAAAAAAAGNMMQTMNNNNSTNNGINHLQQASNMNNVAVNMATSKPMDLSLEHSIPKPISSKTTSRSRGGKPRN